MTEKQTLPPYVYAENTDTNRLMQGDILKVDGNFRDFFKEYYPAINHSDEDLKHVMILTQSCDLVRSASRKPKVTHISVCLVRELKSYMQKLISEELNPEQINGVMILEREKVASFEAKLRKLLNNSDLKMHFFLPHTNPLPSDMTALLALSYPFRVDKYDIMLQNKILELKSEFQAKLGHTLSQLFGRVGTQDLTDFDFDDRKTRKYIHELLLDFKIESVPSKSCIDYINKKNSGKGEKSSIKQLVLEFEGNELKESFSGMKRELLKNICNALFDVFKSQDQIADLKKMSDQNLRKKIGEILKAAANGK